MLSLKNILFVIPTGLLALPLASCSSSTSTPNQGSTAGCPEFTVGGSFDANVKVDARVRAFMQASADLGTVADTLKPAVKNACIGIASDLGAPDTWSAHGDSDDAISNGAGDGACDVAHAKIAAIMSDTANVNANFALVVTRGACYSDFSAEENCEAGCSAQEKCDPGTVETRCDPAQLNVMCSGSCSSQAYCEGKVDVEANCDGQCEAECKGSCSGECTFEDGHRTTGDANCNGKCKDHCTGKCTGRCQVQASAGIQCGDSVTCTGGCTSTYTSPRCEAEFKPPVCTIDENCFESCRANVAAKVVCDPPSVKLLADVNVSANVGILVATINKNLPPLIQTADTQSKVAVDIIQNVVASGESLVQGAGSLDVHSVECATAAAESLGKTAGTLSVATTSGAQVTNDCSSRAD